jgi:hypothetical protein
MIESLLMDYHQINIEKVTTSVYGDHRTRMVRTLGRIVNKLYNLRDWTFRYVERSYIVPAGDWDGPPLPENWSNEGQEGFVQMINDPFNILSWMRMGEITKLTNLPGAANGDPHSYSVGSVNTGTFADSRRIRIYPGAGAADVPLFIRFHANGLTLNDSNPGGLDTWPPHWTDVLYEALVLAEMKAKGDVQEVPLQMQEVKDLIYNMICEERQGKPGIDFMPRYPGASDVYDTLDIV